MSILNLYFSNDLKTLHDEFIRSALAGDEKRAKEIISLDTSVVNYQDPRSGLSAIMVFAADGNKEMVETISTVDGVELSLEDNSGRDAAMMAFAIGRPDISDAINDALTNKLLEKEELTPEELDEVYQAYALEEGIEIDGQHSTGATHSDNEPASSENVVSLSKFRGGPTNPSF